MKQSLLLTALIFSGLALNAQNLTNISINDQMAFNDNNNPIQQQSIVANNIDLQVQVGNGGSSALQSFGNSSNKNTNKVQSQQKINTNPVVQVNNVSTNPNNVNRNRGNNFDVNDNVLDNNVGNENVNRGRGGNILVNDNNNIQSNPVVNDTKKTVASKPVVKEYQGLDFKPSGLSGRDYSNGGKLKKGQKNFYTPSVTKHKIIHKKRPSNKKVKHHTSKCAKW